MQKMAAHSSNYIDVNRFILMHSIVMVIVFLSDSHVLYIDMKSNFWHKRLYAWTSRRGRWRNDTTDMNYHILISNGTV